MNGGKLQRQRRTGETIFTTRAGTPLIAGNILKRYVRPACERLGIGFSGFHDCCHSVVTSLLKKTVARIAGHSDVRVTLNTYAHVSTEDLRAPLASCVLL